MRQLHTRYGRTFTWQWHLAQECGYHCRHCYVHDHRTRLRERQPLDAAGAFAVLHALDAFYDRLEHRVGRTIGRSLVLTGGDPLLAPFFDDLVEEAHARGYRLGVLGCPETCTPPRADFLHAHGVRYLQFSLDGLESTHDALRRSPGSFRRTLERARELQPRFETLLMATVHPGNAHEMVPLIRHLHRTGIRSFDFARISFLGSGADLACMSPQRWRSLLEAIWHAERQLQAEGKALRIGRKDPLWRLFAWEKGLYTPPDRKQLTAGCPCGIRSLTLLADGTVMMCRRFHSPLGRLPRDDAFDLYERHPLLVRLRDPRNLEGCAACVLRWVCRGCLAVGASHTGEPGRRDPQCWRIVTPGQTPETPPAPASG